MTTTYTTTSTFTRTHAKYLASKIAADLRQMQLLYGRPSDHDIIAYLEEVIILLLGGYLKSVSYGFKRGDDWIMALKYDAYGSGVFHDDRAGRVRSGANIIGSRWSSYLTYSDKFLRLPVDQRERVEAQLPFRRSYGEEPRASWISDKSYSNGGVSLQRSMTART